MQQLWENDMTKAAKLVLDGHPSMEEMRLLGTHIYDAVKRNSAGSGTSLRKSGSGLDHCCNNI